MYIKPIKLKNVVLESNIFLAPMAGVTDKAFRTIISKYSKPGLICTEMVSSKALFYNDKKTIELTNTEREPRLIAVQIFGSEPEIMAFAAKKIQEKADIIDINMGCPAPKVVKNGDGSKLLLNLDLVEKIVKEVVHATEKPVSVKLRKGWDEKNIVAVEAAKRIEKAGASLITIHGRTREEYYSGKIDLEAIKQVKQAVLIPVIGNGDIKTTKDAIKMFQETNVDGIMIGRATLGNPWLIADIKKELAGEKIEEHSPAEKLSIMLEHLELEIELKGEYVGIREMRKHLCWYLRNMKDSSKIREEVNRIENKEQLEQVLKEYFKII